MSTLKSASAAMPAKAKKWNRGRVEAVLLPILHTGDINAKAIADALGSTRWTLLRKLKAEGGVTFEQLLDQLRHKMALHYLSGKTSVTETAYLVGFSEAAAFSRAFKRWTGRSPRDWRP